MGIVLRHTSLSPNIKERADCSAAVFTADGEMLAQAEHIPVHLGSMPESVAACLRALRPRARRPVRGQRPVRRRHPSQRPDPGRSGVHRSGAHRMGRQSGSSRRCRRGSAGVDAGSRHSCRPGGPSGGADPGCVGRKLGRGLRRAIHRRLTDAMGASRRSRGPDRGQRSWCPASHRIGGPGRPGPVSGGGDGASRLRGTPDEDRTEPTSGRELPTSRTSWSTATSMWRSGC